MPDTKQLLERTARRAPNPRYEPETIRDRAGRRRRTERARATALALALTVVVGVAAFAVLADGPAASVASGDAIGSGSLPAASIPPIVAADGEYYVHHVLLVAPCGDACTDNDVALDATYRWSPSDDSGRIDVESRIAFGIDPGTFAPGTFPNPNGIEVAGFPADPDEMLRFLTERSAADGASPAPNVSPAAGAPSSSGTLWRAITDLLADPHVTPAVRATLLEAAAKLPGAAIVLDDADPFGRPAHVIAFPAEGGLFDERLYVDPVTHDLLAITTALRGEDAPARYYVVASDGVVPSIDAVLTRSAIPATGITVAELRTLEAGSLPPAQATPVVQIPDRCSQEGPALTLERSAEGDDRDCFVVEAGAPFTITFRDETLTGELSIDAQGGATVFAAEPARRPDGTVYRIPGIDWIGGGANVYEIRDGDVIVATLYIR